MEEGIINRIFTALYLLVLSLSAFGYPKPDSVKFDRAVHGRPFDLDEIFGKQAKPQQAVDSTAEPAWVRQGSIPGDSTYFGIGRSKISQDEADDQARLRFAQHVAVKVQSIAKQQIAENKDRLEEGYTYESLVATDMTLRAVIIAARFVSKDSIYYSLIKYRKVDYHRLVTQEIQIALEATIRKQELKHQVAEALRADSLRHKIAMDSLALSRKQAVIDSLDAILKMEEKKLQQEQDRINLIRNRYAAFLKLKPRHLLIDVPTATTPDSWFHLAGRWDPQSSHIRELNLGFSLWLLTAQASIRGTESMADEAEASVKLEILPSRGEIYPVQLALGYLRYVSILDEAGGFDLRQPDRFGSLSEEQRESWEDPENQGASFMVAGSVGLPQFSTQISAYADKRKFSLGAQWYPFPRNMGDAISIINQLDVIRDKRFRNRFDDAYQWQLGLRLIAIPNRFATMISYEDHEVWMLNFEFQY